MKLKARRLGLPFSLPPKPDPIRQNTFTGEVLKEQPFIFDICHFLQAIEHDRQLDFAYEISRCIFGGTKDWHKDNNLIEVTNKLGLDFQSISNFLLGSEKFIVTNKVIFSTICSRNIS